MFDAFVPFSLAAFPAAFFIAYGGPNHERSSPPLLTVPLLLTGEHQEEGEEASEREDGTSGVWALQRSFFVPEIVCGAKSFTAFPFVRSRRALPHPSAVLHRLLVVVGKVVNIALKLSSTV